MLQTIVRKPDMQQYLSKNSLLHTPFFLQSMPYCCFIKIKEFLHFSKYKNCGPENHPNRKLNLFSTATHKILLVSYSWEIIIDENLLHKGCLSWVQYIPLKRAHFGIQMWMLCEANCSGYVWDMIIYTGQGTFLSEAYTGLSLSAQVVMNLISPLLGKDIAWQWIAVITPQLAGTLVVHTPVLLLRRLRIGGFTTEW